MSRGTYRAFSATVTDLVSLTTQMRRVTLSAAQFTDYRLIRPDDFFGLLIPGPEGLDLPASGLTGPSPRATAALLPGQLRPEMRWYSVRCHRPEAAEIDVDVVLHGDDEVTSGPGSRWAAAAKHGDVVGFVEGNGLYNPPEDSRRQVFFADVTALPALASLLESEEPAPGRPALGAESTANIEVEYESDIQPIDTATNVRWHVRAGSSPGVSIPRLLDGSPRGAIGYAWVCAEASLVREARRFLISAGMAKERIAFSGYWRLGEARR